MNLTIEREEKPEGVVLITVTGEIDMNSSPQLRSELKAVSKTKPSAIHLNLTSIDYFDSSGIAVLIEGKKWCQKKKSEFVLVGLSEKVRGVLELSKLLDLFNVNEG